MPFNPAPPRPFVTSVAPMRAPVFLPGANSDGFLLWFTSRVLYGTGAAVALSLLVLPDFILDSFFVAATFRPLIFIAAALQAIFFGLTLSGNKSVLPVAKVLGVISALLQLLVLSVVVEIYVEALFETPSWTSAAQFVLMLVACLHNYLYLWAFSEGGGDADVQPHAPVGKWVGTVAVDEQALKLPRCPKETFAATRVFGLERARRPQPIPKAPR